MCEPQPQKPPSRRRLGAKRISFVESHLHRVAGCGRLENHSIDVRLNCRRSCSRRIDQILGKGKYNINYLIHIFESSLVEVSMVGGNFFFHL